MTRSVPVMMLLVLLVGGVAHAQGTGANTLPSGATIVFEHRQIYDAGQKKFVEPDAGSTDLFHYFNLAHCNCAQIHTGSAPGTIGDFRYHVRMTNLSGATKQIGVDFWVGSNCTDMTARNPSTGSCKLIDSIGNIDVNLFPGGKDQPFNLYDVINGKTHQGEACLQSDNITAPIYAFVNTTGMPDTYDYTTSQNAGTLSTDTTMTAGVDTQPPVLPTNLVARPNEGAIDLSWTTPNSKDIAYYQALCAGVDGSPVHTSGTDAPQYVTTQSVCLGAAVPSSEVPSRTTLDNGEDEVAPPTGEFAALAPKFICGQVNSGTATSLSIRHLENNTPYQVILVAVDLHGNFVATYFDHTITPHLVTDFWEDLHNRGSKTEGGLCLLAETYGDDSALTGMLRAFRDDTLGGSRAGRWLSDAYYATLGRLGAYVHGSLALRVVAAVLLAPLVALALAWHWLTLPGVLGLIAAAWWWRRRRRLLRRWRPWYLGWLGARGPTFLAFAVIALGADRALAGGGFQPYWEDSDPTKSDEQPAANESDLVNWHVGVRVGPYVPDIDDQLGVHPGPYEQMFGNNFHVLPMLDVDRILWTSFGQVGVGASIGYLQKTARAFAMTSSPTDAMRPREPGAHNAFRLLPLELSATYRLTVLDDDYGVPVIPYVRGGLAYYVWWISAPNGNYARICNDEGLQCGNKALGGSLGVQGAIGLAIRAERIDASTAMSMRASGIQHAGIYGELSLAKVDGFGSDTKLSVGDRTWFAGVDFEF